MIDRLVQLYESVGTRDVVQIAILALVIYAVWHFLGKTSGSIGRGLGLVVVGLFLVAQVIVASLDLIELRVVLDYILTAVVVALLVIFQPELRRGLMLLGQSGVWRYFAPQNQPIADRLADAAEALARDCVGALIVIERDVNLTQYCETGDHIDAEISAPLIRTIFSPRSPLHDGAVILRQGRIAAAACQLPLRVRDAQNREYGGYHMGMRHRAALCMSEESDAVLLVVSEETGRISLAIAGQLEPVPRENLARQLAEVLTSEAPVARKVA